MAACNPPGSPIFRGKRRHLEIAIAKKDEKMRIHRIRLVSEGTCEVVSVQSPSYVWVRLRNHICNDLRISRPDPFEPLEGTPEKFSYVMAPMSPSNLYARSRVVQVEHLEGAGCVVYVHFIDDGYGQWIKLDSLTEMAEALYTHPWQAIPISLFKLALGAALTDYDRPDVWSDEQTNRLSDILTEYKLFRVVPVHDSRRNDRIDNEYGDYARAELYGLPEGDEDSVGPGESIAHRFTLEKPAFPTATRRSEKPKLDYFNRDLYDAAQQDLPSAKDEVEKIATEFHQLFHPMDDVDKI